MIKLLLTLVFSLLLAGLLLDLRQQRLELNYQTNKLHNEIRDTQTKLWNQQLQIATFTAPNAISQTVGDHDLNMVSISPLPAKHWLDPSQNPDAE